MTIRKFKTYSHPVKANHFFSLCHLLVRRAGFRSRLSSYFQWLKLYYLLIVSIWPCTNNPIIPPASRPACLDKLPIPHPPALSLILPLVFVSRCGHLNIRQPRFIDRLSSNKAGDNKPQGQIAGFVCLYYGLRDGPTHKICIGASRGAPRSFGCF